MLAIKHEPCLLAKCLWKLKLPNKISFGKNEIGRSRLWRKWNSFSIICSVLYFGVEQFWGTIVSSESNHLSICLRYLSLSRSIHARVLHLPMLCGIDKFLIAVNWSRRQFPMIWSTGSSCCYTIGNLLKLNNIYPPASHLVISIASEHAGNFQRKVFQIWNKKKKKLFHKKVLHALTAGEMKFECRRKTSIDILDKTKLVVFHQYKFDFWYQKLVFSTQTNTSGCSGTEFENKDNEMRLNLKTFLHSKHRTGRLIRVHWICLFIWTESPGWKTTILANSICYNS